MPSARCVYCDKGVYSNHRALECDVCQRWQHLRCGNTGVTTAQYQSASRDGTELQFTCASCRDRSETMEVDQETTINYSNVTADRTNITLHLPSANSSVLESTRISAGDESIYERDTIIDTSDFDVARPERVLPTEVHETSIEDESVTEVAMEVDVTYEIVDGGSNRGAAKLVSSTGYTYVKKRELKNGTIDWRCSVRGQKTGCPATVKQSGQEFRVAGGDHTHEPRPGILTAVRIKTEIWCSRSAHVRKWLSIRGDGKNMQIIACPHAF